MKGYTCFSVEKRVWVSPKNKKIIILFRQTSKCHTEGKLVFWSARGRLYRWNEMPFSEATVHPHISLKIFLSLSLIGSWDLLNWKITTLVAPSVCICHFLNWKSVGVDLVLSLLKANIIICRWRKLFWEVFISWRSGFACKQNAGIS